MSIDWRVLKVWAVIALVAAGVASVHMAFVVVWSDKRHRELGTMVAKVGRYAQATDLELEVVRARLKKVEEALFGEEGVVP